MNYFNPETGKFTKSPVRDADGKDISRARLWGMWFKFWKDRP